MPQKTSRSQNGKTNTGKPKHVCNRLIISLALLGASVLFLAFGYLADQSPITQSPNNCLPGITLAILGAIFFIAFLFGPKSREDAERRQKRREQEYIKPPPSHSITGILLCAVGGLMCLGLIIPLFSLTDKALSEAAGPNGIKVALSLALCGALLLVIGIDVLRGDFALEAMQRKEARRNRPYRGVYLSKEQIHNLKNRVQLPRVNVPIFLHPAEVAVYHSCATRIETENRVTGAIHGLPGGYVPIFKGFFLRGRSQSRLLYEDVTSRYPGEFVITNERIIFLSDRNGWELHHFAITAAFVSKQGMTFQSPMGNYELRLPCADLAALAFEGIRTGNIPLRRS